MHYSATGEFIIKKEKFTNTNVIETIQEIPKIEVLPNESTPTIIHASANNNLTEPFGNTIEPFGNTTEPFKNNIEPFGNTTEHFGNTNESINNIVETLLKNANIIKEYDSLELNYSEV